MTDGSVSCTPNIGALIIRIGFGGTFFYNHSKEPQNPILIIKAATLDHKTVAYVMEESMFVLDDLWQAGVGKLPKLCRGLGFIGYAVKKVVHPTPWVPTPSLGPKTPNL